MYTTCPVCKHNPVAPGATLCPDCESARPALLTLTRCPRCRFYYMVAGDAMCAMCLTSAPTLVLKPQDIPFEEEHICDHCGHYHPDVTPETPFCPDCYKALCQQFGKYRDRVQGVYETEFPSADWCDEPYAYLQNHTHTDPSDGPCWCPRGIPLKEVLR